MRRVPFLLVGIAVVSVTLLAQTPATPSFEVASIKPNPDFTVREALSVQPNGVRFTAFPLRTLITMAYRAEAIQRFDQLVGAPSWIAVERFDVDAKFSNDSGQQPPMQLIPAMLRTLLRERFRLQVHTDKRRLPAFSLVVARGDRQLGPQLQESVVGCSQSGKDGDRWCGIRAAGGVITGRFVTASELAGNLSGYPMVDRFVADRTGLTARYDFRMEYAPTSEPGDADSTDRASLFTALTEQLGLKLEREMLLLPVLVIDHVERPTEN